MSAVVVNKNTFEIVKFPNTPDYPAEDWLHDPAGLSSLMGTVDKRYWKAVEDDIVSMSESEIDGLAPTDEDRLAKKLEIKQSYSTEAFGPIEVDVLGIGDKWYNADPMTQQNLTALMAMEDSTLYPFSDTAGGASVWTEHTHEQLVDIARSIRSRNMILYMNYESIKAAVDSSLSLADLNTISW